MLKLQVCSNHFMPISCAVISTIQFPLWCFPVIFSHLCSTICIACPHPTVSVTEEKNRHQKKQNAWQLGDCNIVGACDRSLSQKGDLMTQLLFTISNEKAWLFQVIYFLISVLPFPVHSHSTPSLEGYMGIESAKIYSCSAPSRAQTTRTSHHGSWYRDSRPEYSHTQYSEMTKHTPVCAQRSTRRDANTLFFFFFGLFHTDKTFAQISTWRGDKREMRGRT